MVRTIGGHLVGMSTTLEAIAAREAGVEVLGISLVTNFAAGMTGEPLNHEEVLAAGANLRDADGPRCWPTSWAGSSHGTGAGHRVGRLGRLRAGRAAAGGRLVGAGAGPRADSTPSPASRASSATRSTTRCSTGSCPAARRSCTWPRSPARRRSRTSRRRTSSGPTACSPPRYGTAWPARCSPAATTRSASPRAPSWSAPTCDHDRTRTTAWARWRRRRSGRCTTTGTGWRWPRCGSGRSATVRCPDGTCRPGCRRTTCAGSSTPCCARRTSASRSCTASRRTPGGGGTWHPRRRSGTTPTTTRRRTRSRCSRRPPDQTPDDPDVAYLGGWLAAREPAPAPASGSGADTRARRAGRPGHRRPVRARQGVGRPRTPTATPATSSRRCWSPTRSRSWPTGSTDGWSSAPPGCAAGSAPDRTG